MVSNAINPDFVCYTLVGSDCVVQEKDGKKFILALQLKVGVRNGEQTYVVAFVGMKLNQFMEGPDQITKVLEDFTDIIPLQLPKSLLRRAYDHKLELKLGAKPPA